MCILLATKLVRFLVHYFIWAMNVVIIKNQTGLLLSFPTYEQVCGTAETQEENWQDSHLTEKTDKNI